MKYHTLAIMFLILFSCGTKKSQKNKKIEIDISQEYDHDLPKLTIESVVPFEMREMSVFGDIHTMDYIFDRVYILDIYSSKSLLVFTKEGKFINKTKIGKGPGELTDPFAFYVDLRNNNILVYDQTLNSIFKFDLDLNFLSKEKYKGVPFLDFAMLKDSRMLVLSHFHYDYTFTLYSSDYSTKEQYNQDIKYGGVQFLSSFISTTDQRTLLISAWDNNIYELDKDKIYSKYYLDFGSHGINISDVENSHVADIWGLIKSENKVSSPLGISESANFLWFNVFYSGELVNYFYSLNEEVIYGLNNYFEAGILPKCRVMGTVEGDVFYAIVTPSDMSNFQEETKNKIIDTEITLAQNPFIMTFRISNP